MCFCSKVLVMGMIAGAFCSGLSAQHPDSVSWKTIEQVQYGNAWISSENAAGLFALPSIQISVAEGYAAKGNGSFVNYGNSDNSLRLGAYTESYYRLNSKVALYGLLDYYNFTGKNMSGSYFINPDDAPFNIIEYTDENRGEKEMEHYHLAGAAAIELSERVVLGGKFDYKVANYGKMKDLRHKSELMDMAASIGIIMRLNSRFELGAAAIYRRRVEGVILDMYGKTDKTYNSLIDYGVFWGKKEQFGDDGYTSDGEEKPLADNRYGTSLQAHWKMTDRWQLFNEMTLCARDGYYGKKSPSTVVFSNHDGFEFCYKGILSFKSDKSNHIFEWKARYNTVKNRENIYRYDNEGGGLTNVNYYGELDTSDKKHLGLYADYIGYWGVNNGAPAWITKGGFGFYSRDITASLYPYYRTQQLHRYCVNVAVEHIIYGKKGACTFHIGSEYQKGGGALYEDKIYVSSAASSNMPHSMPLYLMQEHEYFTKPRAKGELGVKYARQITDKGLKAHISILYGYTKAFNVAYLQGDNAHELQLTVGCTF